MSCKIITFLLNFEMKKEKKVPEHKKAFLCKHIHKIQTNETY